jgi:hypothetical protein
MKTIIKVSAILFGLAATALCLELNSTGELIAARKSFAEWPPLALIRPQLSYAFESDKFMIHYEKEGPNAVYNPDEDINPEDGVPDYINRVAEYLELSYYVYANDLGFDYPPPDDGAGGNDKYDIYVADVIGITVPDVPSNYYPGRAAYTAYSFIGHDLRTHRHPDDPLPFLMATCSHELFHAFQIAYRAFPSDDPPWWYELTADWAEERVFDDLNEVYHYLPDYYQKIDRSIYLTGGSHMYGAWVLAEYLSENYGNNIIKSIFTRLISYDNSITAINSALTDINQNINSCFADFARWNYFTSSRWCPGYFEEGAYFPESVPISITHATYPTGIIETPRAVENLGCAYIVFLKPEQLKANLNILFNADPLHPLHISVTAIYSSSILERVYRVERNGQAHIRIEDFARTESVVLSVFWPYEGVALADTAYYYYWAEIDTVNSGIEAEQSASPHNFEIMSIYPNPFNSNCLIEFAWPHQTQNYQMQIFDICGRLIDQSAGIAQSGINSVGWRPELSIGAGVYFCRISIDGTQKTSKILYLK